MSRIKEYTLILLSLAVLIISIFMLVNNKDNNEKQEDKVVNNTEETDEIDEETYAKLQSESKDETIKQKVMDYLASDNYYHIQEELKYNGKTYKSVQICNLEHVDYSPKGGEYRHYTHDMLYMYYAKDENVKKIFDESLESDNYILADTEEGDEISDLIFYRMPSIKSSPYDSKISFYRDKDFGFMEEYCITALVCYSDNGDIEDVVTFHGATGIHIKENESSGLIWEVYIAEQNDYYWHIVKYEDGERGIVGGSYSSGTVYDFYIDDNKVNDIRFKYKSWDNLAENTSAFYWVYQGQKMYVKNYTFSIQDVINSDEYINKLKEYEKNKTSLSREELVQFAQDTFGKSTCKYLALNFDDPYYFTKDGYLVGFEFSVRMDGTVEDYLPIYYLKMTPEEYMDMEHGKKREYIWENKKPLFVDGEVNQDLLKELEGK